MGRAREGHAGEGHTICKVLRSEATWQVGGIEERASKEAEEENDIREVAGGAQHERGFLSKGQDKYRAVWHELGCPMVVEERRAVGGRNGAGGG